MDNNKRVFSFFFFNFSMENITDKLFFFFQRNILNAQRVNVFDTFVGCDSRGWNKHRRSYDMQKISIEDYLLSYE